MNDERISQKMTNAYTRYVHNKSTQIWHNKTTGQLYNEDRARVIINPAAMQPPHYRPATQLQEKCPGQCNSNLY